MPKILVVRLYRVAPLCPGTVALFSPFQLSLAPASPSHLHLSTAPAVLQPLRLQHPPGWLRATLPPVSPFGSHRAVRNHVIRNGFCYLFQSDECENKESSWSNILGLHIIWQGKILVYMWWTNARCKKYYFELLQGKHLIFRIRLLWYCSIV